MIKQLIAAAALAGVAAVSHAAEPVSASFPNPFYIGADAGATKVTGSADGNKSSYGFFAGYNFNSTFAVEAGFRRLYTWDTFSTHEHASQKALSLIGTLPLTQNLGIYGRIGVNEITAHGSWDGQAGIPGFSYKDSTTHALLGVGVSYKLSDHVSVRAEVQRPHPDLTNYSAGISYAF